MQDWILKLLKLLPPTTYQGGKQRIVSQILDIINPSIDKEFYDLCCGSGSISLELVNRGLAPSNIHMIDASPWGLFWEMVGSGTFDIDIFNVYCLSIPKEINKIQDFLRELSKTPSNIDTAYIFLLLQSGSFGGKALWIRNNKWMNCSFRSYWLPTAISNRRSPVNPMMPMPDTLFKRTEYICQRMLGVKGKQADIMKYDIAQDATVYIDPPYKNTTLYGYDLDINNFIDTIRAKCYISEGKALSIKAYKIISTRKKGGISGERKSSNEEWLSEIN